MGLLINNYQTGQQQAQEIIYKKIIAADYSDKNDWTFQGRSEVACNMTPA